MRFFQVLRSALVFAASISLQSWDRLEKNNETLPVVEIALRLAQAVRDHISNDLRNDMFAHAALGRSFDLLVIIPTLADRATDSLLLEELKDICPDVTIVHGQDEVNAWDNPEFQAVYTLDITQLIVGAKITQLLGTAILALSLVETGYQLYAIIQASEAFNIWLAEEINRCRKRAVLALMGLFAISCDLIHNWQ